MSETIIEQPKRHAAKIKISEKEAEHWRKYYGATTDDHLRILSLLEVYYRGLHHLPGKVKWLGHGAASVNERGDLSTFDFDGLTRLVMLAHAYCVRVSVEAGGPGAVKLLLHCRHYRTGGMPLRHPRMPVPLGEPEWEVAPFEEVKADE